MAFSKEADFEQALIDLLKTKGWEDRVLKNYSEAELIRNWADILFENNRGIDRLNDFPLTDGEMQQIIEQITTLRTPLRLNGFINGGSVSIKRDNPDDVAHFGKEVSLKIYERREIAAGQSRYQIVQQPKFPTRSKLMNDRRGDLMLLQDILQHAGGNGFCLRQEADVLRPDRADLPAPAGRAFIPAAESELASGAVQDVAFICFIYIVQGFPAFAVNVPEDLQDREAEDKGTDRESQGDEDVVPAETAGLRHPDHMDHGNQESREQGGCGVAFHGRGG